jgi:hypothetical protein
MTTDAIGWSLHLCDENHIHLQLIGERDHLLGELVLADIEDVSQLCNDLSAVVNMLRMRKIN